MALGKFKGRAMSRQRDYKAEYQRRIANAAKRGLSKSQGRGHARAGEASARSKPVKSDDRLESALKLLRQSGNQSRAAKEAGVSAERFRRFLKDNALAERRGRFWKVTDQRQREMLVASRGEVQRRDLRDFDQASLNGEHLNAVKKFLNSNDAGLLAPFVGKSVIDAKGDAHPLETDPNALHRLASAGSEVFDQVYRLKN